MNLRMENQTMNDKLGIDRFIIYDNKSSTIPIDKKHEILFDIDYNKKVNILSTCFFKMNSHYKKFTIYVEGLKRLKITYEDDISYYDDSQMIFPQIPTPDNSQSNTDTSGG